MEKGVVKFINTQKHFGFITREGSDEQVFVHESGLKCTVNENDKVVFDIEKGPKGLFAVNVQIDQ
jgi:CspA family cold shock protein